MLRLQAKSNQPTDNIGTFDENSSDIRYSKFTDTEYNELVDKYGAIEQGENPIFNDTPVPKQTNDNTKVRRATRTILEGGKLTDDMVDEIELETLKGAYNYEVYSDKSALAKAQKSVEDGSAMSEWEHAYRNGKVNKDTITLGALLIKLAVDNGVCVYAKLQKGFSIPTPVGNYSPNWAIAFNEGTVKHIYFIAETKGTMESLNLKPIEQAKISCAKKLFNDLSTNKVRYEAVNDYQHLLDVMNAIK